MNRNDSREGPSSDNWLGAEQCEFKDAPLDTFGGQRDVESNLTDRDAEDSSITQAGVKNIEAVSMTWTKWGLIAAYARSVHFNAKRKLPRG